MFRTIELNARPVELSVTMGAPDLTNEKSKLYKKMPHPSLDYFYKTDYNILAQKVQQKINTIGFVVK